MDNMFVLFQSGAVLNSLIIGTIFFILAYGLAVLLIAPWLPPADEEHDRKFRFGAGVGAALVALAVAAGSSPSGASTQQVAKVEAKSMRPMARDGLVQPVGSVTTRIR